MDFYLDIKDRDACTWMDPSQYYHFAKALVSGARGFNDFEVPSIFPFFLAPFTAITGTIPAALATNGVFVAILAAALHRLRGRLEIPAPSFLVSMAVLSTPLLIGLSRSLYAELALTALVAVQFVLWFETRDFSRKAFLALLVTV